MRYKKTEQHYSIMPCKKPIIIVCGMPQSYTSAITRFLWKNGARLYHEKSNFTAALPYDKFESAELEDYVARRWKFQTPPDMTDFFARMPDETIVLKYPTIFWFLHSIRRFTDRELRIVWCVRNPIKNLMSCNDKNGWGYERNSAKYSYAWEAMLKTDCHICFTERILAHNDKAARDLLDYCGLAPDEINYDGIRQRKPKVGYIRYRLRNAILKRLI